MTATTIIINDETPRRQYTATAGQTLFDFPFPFFADGDLTVWLTPNGNSPDDTADLLTITTDYTVAGANTQDGGEITLTSGATAGDIITIERIVDIKRISDFQTAGDLLAETLNAEQDIEIMISQQLRQDIDRALKRSKSSTSGADLTIPEPESLKHLRWNAAADGLENADSGTSFTGDSDDISHLPSGTGATSTSVGAKLRETVSVKDFGATGDGVTDDTAAIQAALDYVNGSNRTLVFPEGDYVVTSTLTITGDCTVDGMGAKISFGTSADVCIDITGDNVTIKDLIIHGTDTTDVAVSGSDAIQCIGASSASYIENIRIYGCEIKYFGDIGVELQYVKNSEIRNNHIERIGVRGIRGLSVSNVSFTENRVINVYPGLNGTPPYLNAYGITVTSASADPVSEHCLIDGNYIQDVTSWEGLDTHSGSHITFSNNRIYNCRTGIAITTNTGNDCEGIVVIGNTIEGFSSGSVSRDATTFETGGGIVGNMGDTGSQGLGLVITGNHIRNHGGKTSGSTAGGIKVERARSVTITGNSVRNAFRYGIRAAATTDDCAIYGNVVYTVNDVSGVRHGVSFSTTTSASCDGNIVQGAGTDAFSIPTPSSSQYYVIFGEGNRTPDGSSMMSSTSWDNIRSGSYGGSAKAWVRFNGTTGAITESFGVASVVRNSVGDYTITWKEDHANSLVIPASNQYANRMTVMGTNTCTLKTYDSSDALADANPVGVAVFSFKND